MMPRIVLKKGVPRVGAVGIARCGIINQVTVDALQPNVVSRGSQHSQYLGTYVCSEDIFRLCSVDGAFALLLIVYLCALSTFAASIYCASVHVRLVNQYQR